MQIVINMPEEYYNFIKNNEDRFSGSRIYDCVLNGTILPKNHGRLIDAEQLMNYCQNQIDGHKYADCNVIARFPIVLNAEEKE